MQVGHSEARVNGMILTPFFVDFFGDKPLAMKSHDLSTWTSISGGIVFCWSSNIRANK